MPHSPASTALARFKVLDLTRVRAGPTCARQLADFFEVPVRRISDQDCDDLVVGFALLHHPQPADRARWLNQATAGEPELRAEVASLLLHHDGAGAFLSAPASALADEPLRGDDDPAIQFLQPPGGS